VVHDPSGLPVPGVKVTLGEPPTEIVQQTDARGRYAFYNVTTGTYRLRAQMPGFKMLTRPRVTIEPGMQALAPAVLEIGGLSETLTIEQRPAGAAESDAQSSAAGARTSPEETALLAALAAAPAEPLPYSDLARYYDTTGRPEHAGRLRRRAEELARGRQMELTRAQQAQASATATRVGGDVGVPLSLRHIVPEYPPAAAGTNGVVILEGRIGTDGAIQDARVLRSVPAFDAAALGAFEQWRYAPTLLNGSPIAVVVTVVMNFASQ
jgi:TonB family protein